MTQVYDSDNRLVPVTVVEAGPCPVTQIKTLERDGYSAVQIGFKEQKDSRVAASQRGHFKKAGVNTVARMKEFRVSEGCELKVGDILDVNSFSEGDRIDVIGTTKGRGFQGVVKRYGFAGGKDSHGSMMHRRGGSYGHCQWPGEVQKNKKMPGHMGAVQRTMQNLSVVKIIEDKNLILVRGSFPGANGSEVVIRSGKKQKKN